MGKLYRIEPIWKGRDVVVIGGGPSLSFDQLRIVAAARLEDRCRVIAVNDQIFWAWWADWLHGSDFKWWNWHKNTATKFPGIKTTVTETVPEAWVTGWIKATGQSGFDPDPSQIRTGGNGVYQAMHIAAHAGAKRIITLGLDMQKSGNSTHCHSGHPDRITTDYAQTMLPHFETLKPALDERGVDVVNCSPGSAVTCFRQADVKTLLCG